MQGSAAAPAHPISSPRTPLILPPSISGSDGEEKVPTSQPSIPMSPQVEFIKITASLTELLGLRLKVREILAASRPPHDLIINATTMDPYALPLQDFSMFEVNFKVFYELLLHLPILAKRKQFKKLLLTFISKSQANLESYAMGISSLFKFMLEIDDSNTVTKKLGQLALELNRAIFRTSQLATALEEDADSFRLTSVAMQSFLEALENFKNIPPPEMTDFLNMVLERIISFFTQSIHNTASLDKLMTELLTLLPVEANASPVTILVKYEELQKLANQQQQELEALGILNTVHLRLGMSVLGEIIGKPLARKEHKGDGKAIANLLNASLSLMETLLVYFSSATPSDSFSTLLKMMQCITQLFLAIDCLKPDAPHIGPLISTIAIKLSVKMIALKEQVSQRLLLIESLMSELNKREKDHFLAPIKKDLLALQEHLKRRQQHFETMLPAHQQKILQNFVNLATEPATLTPAINNIHHHLESAIQDSSSRDSTLMLAPYNQKKHEIFTAITAGNPIVGNEWRVAQGIFHHIAIKMAQEVAFSGGEELPPDRNPATTLFELLNTKGPHATEYLINSLVEFLCSQPGNPRPRRLVNPLIWAEAVNLYIESLYNTPAVEIDPQEAGNIDRLIAPGKELEKFILDLRVNEAFFTRLFQEYRKQVWLLMKR